jgi:hypothetical protein
VKSLAKNISYAVKFLGRPIPFVSFMITGKRGTLTIPGEQNEQLFFSLSIGRNR